MATPLPKSLDGFLALARHPAHAHRGRQFLEPPPKRLYQDEIAHLARGHGEIALGVARIEGLRQTEQALHAGEKEENCGGKLPRLGCRHEALASAHEEFIGKDFAELRKGM